jgi:hypothetical protein
MRKIGIKKIVINNLRHRAVAMRTAKFLNEIDESLGSYSAARRPPVNTRTRIHPA